MWLSQKTLWQGPGKEPKASVNVEEERTNIATFDAISNWLERTEEEREEELGKLITRPVRGETGWQIVKSCAGRVTKQRSDHR